MQASSKQSKSTPSVTIQVLIDKEGGNLYFLSLHCCPNLSISVPVIGDIAFYLSPKFLRLVISNAAI